MSNNEADSLNKKSCDFVQQQLHEQYALNNYNGLSSVVSLFVGLLAAFFAYGHVFFNSVTSKCCDWVTLVISEDKYTALALFLTTTAVCLVLMIMMRICIYQGLFQRKEQFIIHTIRCKHYGKIIKETRIIPNTDYFPKNYTPFNKDEECWLNIIQGLYGEFTKIIIFVYFIIVLSATIRICQLNDSCNCFGLLGGGLLLLLGICYYLVQKCWVQKKYQDIQTEFNEILNNI